MFEENEKYKVTVIIPTYKRPVGLLKNAVESVINQTYTNLEIVIIDDSPFDYECRNEIKKYITNINDKRIKFYQNEKNLGGALARNKGISIATGEFISFLDDDDSYLPNKIKRQVDFMVKHNCDLSFSDMVMYNLEGRIVDFREYKDIESFDNDYLLRYHLMKHMTGTPTFMFKGTKLREIGGFEDVKMGQEFHLMLKAIERNLKIRYIPECDVRVLKHSEGGISQGKNKIIGENRLYQFKKNYFDILDIKAIRYIKFRHYVVMAIAYRRNNEMLKMFSAGIKSLLSSPVNFCKELLSFFRKLTKAKVKNRGKINDII